MNAAGLGPRASTESDDKLAKAFANAQHEVNASHAQSRRARKALAQLQEELDQRGIKINVEVEKHD